MVVTLPVSHWADKATGLAEIVRVMALGATLVVTDVSPDGRFPTLTAWSRHEAMASPWTAVVDRRRRLSRSSR